MSTAPRLTNPVALDVMAREKKRAEECVARKHGGVPSCWHVDQRLGWRTGMTIDDCDLCWEMGPNTTEAAEYREGYCAMVVKNILAMPRGKVATPVLLTIAGRHVDEKYKKEILKELAERTDGEKRVMDEAAKIDAKFEREVRELVAGMDPHQKLLKMDGRTRWEAVKSTWERATSFTKSVASAGLSQTKEAPRSTLNERHISCFGLNLEGERVGEKCPSLATASDGGMYCNDCGCGDKEIARIKTAEGEIRKLLYPYLDCPRRRPGFSNALAPATKQAARTVGPKLLPDGGVVIENPCMGIGDATVFAWLMHSVRAAGYDKVFLNPQRNLSTFDIFSVPPAWRTDITTGKDHPPKGYLGGKGWLRSWLDGYGFEDVKPVRPPYKENRGAAKWASGYWKGRDTETGTKGKRVLLFPEVVWKPREWPMPHWSYLQKLLFDEGYNVITCLQTYKEGHPYPYAFGGVSVERMAAMVKRADLVIGNDSGPTHFAGTLDVPTIVVAGASPPEFFHHTPSVHMLYGGHMPCEGCNFSGDRGYHLRCDSGCNALLLTSPEQVMKEAKEYFP